MVGSVDQPVLQEWTVEAYGTGNGAVNTLEKGCPAPALTVIGAVIAQQDDRSVAYYVGKLIETRIDEAIAAGEIPPEVAEQLKAKVEGT